MLWVRHQSKKGQHGGSLRLPEYAYVVRMSVANLCDIGTSCKTTHKNIGITAISNMTKSELSAEISSLNSSPAVGCGGAELVGTEENGDSSSPSSDITGILPTKEKLHQKRRFHSLLLSAYIHSS